MGHQEQVWGKMEKWGTMEKWDISRGKSRRDLYTDDTQIRQIVSPNLTQLVHLCGLTYLPTGWLADRPNAEKYDRLQSFNNAHEYLHSVAMNFFA